MGNLGLWGWMAVPVAMQFFFFKKNSMLDI